MGMAGQKLESKPAIPLHGDKKGLLIAYADAAEDGAGAAKAGRAHVCELHLGDDEVRETSLGGVRDSIVGESNHAIGGDGAGPIAGEVVGECGTTARDEQKT